MLLALARHSPTMGVGAGSKANESLVALCQQLADATGLQELSDRYRDSLSFRRDFHTRAGQLLVPAASPPGVFAWPLPPADESAIEIARAEIDEIHTSMQRVAARLADDQGAQTVVFGHTHRPYRQTLEGGTTLINCGSWQWLGGYDAAIAKVWRELFTDPTHIVPRHRLTYARIDYDQENVPNARLLDFAEEKGETAEEQVKLGRVLGRLRQTLGNTSIQ
jgi:hypothetical protein